MVWRVLLPLPPRRGSDVLVWRPIALGREVVIDLRQVFRRVCEGAVESD